MSLNFMFEASSGRVLGFASTIFNRTLGPPAAGQAGSTMSNHVFRALLHARLDEHVDFASGLARP